MMKQVILTAAVAAVVAFGVGKYFTSAPAGEPAVPTVKESAYERVIRTGTLRCGYAPWPPLIIKDPNTGALSGILYDFTEALAAALQLKVEWTAEIPYGDIPVALDSHRIDAFCAGAWPNSARSRVIDFTRSIYHVPFFAIVRGDDVRFDGNVDKLNDAAFTISGTDGESSSKIAQQDFAKAKLLSVPQSSDFAVNLTNVVTGKADATLTDLFTFMQFDKNNAGMLKVVGASAPLRVWGSGIAIERGQYELWRMLDLATDELMQSGVVERIIRKYEEIPGSLYRTAPSYVEK